MLACEGIKDRYSHLIIFIFETVNPLSVIDIYSLSIISKFFYIRWHFFNNSFIFGLAPSLRADET